MADITKDGPADDVVATMDQTGGDEAQADAQLKTSSSGGRTDNPIAKLLIGLVAGIAAVILPRLLAAVSTGGDLPIDFIPRAYWYLALVVGLFLGAVTLIFEFKRLSAPRETFMAALAIPAVIAGGLGTASGVGSVGDLKLEADRIRDEFQTVQGIAEGGSFSSFSLVDKAQSSTSGPGSRLLLPDVFPVAFARTMQRIAQAEVPKFGVQIYRDQYLVVLKRSNTRQGAIEEAKRLSSKVPGAHAIRADDSYYVVAGEGPQNRTAALLTASRAKEA